MSSTLMAAKPAPAKLSVSASQQAKSAAEKHKDKMHKRSRSGCFTCRLRRKKCDEGKPGCTACSKLSIKCEYKRPMWWGSSEQRRAQKEMIKNQIKCMKIAEKQAASQQMQMPTPPCSTMSMGTPPSLYHSPADGGMCRTRHQSVDSCFSSQFDFNGNMPVAQDLFSSQSQSPAQAPGGAVPFNFQPFNDCWKMERQWYVNDIESRRDSTISTTYFKPLPPSEEQPFVDNWIREETLEHRQEFLGDEQIDFSMFDLVGPAMRPVILPSQLTVPSSPVKVEDRDEYLLSHFKQVIAPLAFPMLKVNDSAQTHANLLFGALETNQAYFHAALSYAAVHIKATQSGENAELEEDLLRHVQATVQVITGWLSGTAHYDQIAEATLAMIYLRGLVGGLEQDVCELPWLSHFQAAKDALARMETEQASRHMPVAAWIDILGSTMTGAKPAFADLYRDHNINNLPLGLQSFVGCDDSILYLVSEIACLESYKQQNTIDDIATCFHIKSLGDHISQNELNAAPQANAFSATGQLDSAQLAANISHVYRIAARIYLCTLLPDFDRAQPNVQALVASLAEAVTFVPAGTDGFDRSLVWPLLMAGAVCLPASPLRTALAERSALMGRLAYTGAYGRMRAVLGKVWEVNDGQSNAVHWRDVMQQNGWDFLLI